MMACCCSCCLAAQIAEKLKPGYNWLVLGLFLVVWMLGIFFPEYGLHYNFYFTVLGKVYTMSFSFQNSLLLSIVGLILRAKVKELLFINDGNLFTDIFCAFCCNCCNLAQLARTVFGYKSDDYFCNLFSTNGAPEWQKVTFIV